MTDPTTPGGWPDPQRPGVPMNPERDGAHWLCISPATGAVMAFQWRHPHGPDGIGAWTNISKYITTSHPLDAVCMGLTYIGPCLTPAEVAAQVAAAQAAEREACAALFDNTHDRGRIIVGRVNLSCAEARHIAAAIRARGVA